MKLQLFICCLLIYGISTAQNVIAQDLIISDYVEGTLLIPNPKSDSIAIIIPDFGPIDRDGNQNFAKNNALKFLAQDLAHQGIATFRYDKRALILLKKGRLDEQKTRFDDFVNDAKDIISYFKNRRRYKNIYLIGHGQGALVGMLASDEHVNGFISVASSGKSIDEVIIDQLKTMNTPELVKSAESTIAIMKTGKVDKKYNKALDNIFNLGVQPFMISWMQYVPREEINKLKVPTLVINGTNDIDIPVADAELLNSKKHTNLSFILIDEMNHALKKVPTKSTQENVKTYNMPNLKNTPEVAEKIMAFINP